MFKRCLWSLSLVLALSTLASCGYQMGSSALFHRYRTITIPYVWGDPYGQFSSELVKQVASRGCLRYVQSCGEIALNVNLFEKIRTPVGFRYEQNDAGSLGKRLVASEDRLVLEASVQLVDTHTGQVIRGPLCFSAFVDYDFEPESTPQNLTEFSLGQVDYRDAGEAVAKIALYRKLAIQIADYLNQAF